MNNANNDENAALPPSEKATTPTNPQASASDAMVEGMLRSMRLLATDENQRKALAMSWHVWIAEAAKRWG